MYLFHSIMSGILLFCYNWFFFSNNFFIIYEICKFETIIFISQHVGYCEDDFIVFKLSEKPLIIAFQIWLDSPYNTLEIHTLRIFLSSSYELWQDFPKAIYAYFTNNSILGQFFIFSQARSNFPKPHFPGYLDQYSQTQPIS